MLDRELYTKDSGKVFIITYIALLIAQMIVSGILGETDSMVWAAMIANQATFLIVAIYYLKRKRIQPREAWGLGNKLSRKQWLFLPVLTIILMIASSPIAMLFSAFLELLGYKSMGYFPSLVTVPQIIFAILIIALLPAICEEVLFRGVILKGLKRQGYLRSALITALLFALIHGNPEQLIHQFFLGLVFAVIMQATNNIIAPMIMHFTNNFVAIFFDTILAKLGISSIGSLGIVIMVLMVIIGSALTAMAVKYIIRLEKDKRLDKNVIDIDDEGLAKRVASGMKGVLRYLINSNYRKDCNDHYDELMYQLDMDRPQEVDMSGMTQLEWIIYNRNEDFKLIKISIIGTSVIVFITFIIGLF